MANQQENKSACITLQGSAELVAEYLKYGINNILYLRGIYPAETFRATEQYGIHILVSENKDVQKFLENVLEHVKNWLTSRQVERVCLLINNSTTKEVIECWEFKVKYESGVASIKKGLEQPLYSTENLPSSLDSLPKTGNKSLKEIQGEIRDVMRQICSTISFLPLLDCLCTFDVHIYLNKNSEVPEVFDETNPHFISNSQQVKFKSFSTSLHRMDAAVNYKCDF